MALGWQVLFTGSPDTFDIDAAQLMIDTENERRAADLDENGDPTLPPLPDGNPAQVKDSYLTVMEKIVTAAHTDYIRQAAEKQQTSNNVKELWRGATPEQRAAAVAALGG